MTYTPPPDPESFAVVTGASSGIGRALALELGRRGHNLILVARSVKPMEKVKEQLPQVTVQVRSVDLADPLARTNFLEELAQLRVHILINSAGIATFGQFAELDYAHERAQFELNATALFELTAAVIPQMVARGSGGIINVGSAAGNMAIPGNATYVGTKALVNTFTESLHYELKPRGVACTLLAPGPVREGEKASDARTGVDDSVPDFLWTSYEDCATDTLKALDRGRLRVVPGALSTIMNAVSTYVPRRLTAPIIGKFYSKMAAQDAAKKEGA